jgi:peptidoglycan/xylan/chitin deacetylase (PgdA/CDA1 family)
LLGGLAAGLSVAVPTLAFGAPPAGCWSPDALAATPNERLKRHRVAADAFVTPAPASPAPPVAAALCGVIRRVELPAGRKLIALTFDLCQTGGVVAGYDGAIVDYLREAFVPATFFAAGRWLETHKARAAQLAADPLFLLANHSFSHPDLHFASAEKIAAEILLTETALAANRDNARQSCAATASGTAVRLFRFPYGSCTAAGTTAANAIGSIVIQWDVVSGDPDGTSAATIDRNVLAGARPGSIVVMHANGRGTHTAEALRRIVPKLRAQGFTFLTVADLLAAGHPVAVAACYIDHPGDTVRYDVRKKRPADVTRPG